MMILLRISLIRYHLDLGAKKEQIFINPITLAGTIQAEKKGY